MRERIPLFAGLLLLAVAIGVGSFEIADGIRNRNQGDVVTVTGSAKKRIVSDYAIWDASVTSADPSASAAASRLTAWTDKVRAFLSDQGIRDAEVTVQPVSTQTISQQDAKSSGSVPGYQLTRNFEVRSPRVQAVADVAEASSRLLAEGIPFSAQPLQYVYTKLPDLRPELLAAATKDAQNRAKVLVGASGASLGRIRGVNVGVFQVTSPNSTDVSDYGVYDTSTLQKDVTAVVNVTFALR